MKRSDMLKKLARHLSNREVDDIYEDALLEMKFVQEAILERLPNQPWFLQVETIFPLPLGTQFIQLSDNYNGLMTRGGVWFRPVILESGAACGLDWELKKDQYGTEQVIIGESAEAPIKPFLLPALGAPLWLQLQNLYSNSDGNFEYAQSGGNVILEQTPTIQNGYHSIFVYNSSESNRGSIFTTLPGFAPGSLVLYYKLKWPEFALLDEFVLEFSTWREETLVPDDGAEITSVQVPVTKAEFDAEPDKMYKVVIPNPGDFNIIRFYTPQQDLGIDIHDVDLCSAEGATMAWDLSYETNVPF